MYSTKFQRGTRIFQKTREQWPPLFLQGYVESWDVCVERIKPDEYKETLLDGEIPIEWLTNHLSWCDGLE